MGKVLAIDYGLKRTGIAITDSMQIIASGLTTINTKELDSFISNIVIQEDIEIFVVGYPKGLDGKPTDATKYVNIFIKKLKKLYPNIFLYKIDERFTSKIAKKSILVSGVNKKRRKDKGLIDQVSATIILQSYLDYR